jgi:hypothetical protein
MASPSTPDSLTEVLRRLADRLDDLEDRLDRIEGNQAAFTIAATAPYADTPEAIKKPPFKEAQPPTKGKGKAKAQAPAPSTAKPAKKERPTKKGAIPSADLPLPLAQTFTTEGKADRRLVTVVVPDDTAMHIIGKGGKGLKQVHDISGARVHAYTLSTGSRDERHVSIRGTDLQIGDALVVLGKRMSRKRVRPPTTKKTKEFIAPSTPAHPFYPTPKSSATTLPPPIRRPSPSTSGLVEVPTTGEQGVSPTPPSVRMASPLPPPTPIVPSVSMASPSLSPPAAWTPMEVDAVLAYAEWPNPPTDFEMRRIVAGNLVTHGESVHPSAIPSGRGLSTARRSGHRLPRSRGRGK